MSLFAEQGAGKFPIFERGTGTFVGTCGIDPYPLDGKREYEIGYRLLLAHWGKGYATEAARAVLRYGLGDLGLARIIGFAHAENRASVHVLEKLGMRYLGSLDHAGIAHRLYETR